MTNFYMVVLCTRNPLEFEYILQIKGPLYRLRCNIPKETTCNDPTLSRSQRDRIETTAVGMVVIYQGFNLSLEFMRSMWCLFLMYS